MDKAELIRHEIEKRRDHNLAIGNPLFAAMAEEDIELLSFIDSLQGEPVSEDLEEEAARKQTDKILEFSNKIIGEVAEFAKDSVDQEGWATSLLMGLARATSVVIRGLEKASDDSDSSLMKHYVTHVLPLCDLVTQKHETRVEEAMANIDVN